MTAEPIMLGSLPTSAQLALEERKMTIVTELLTRDPSIGFVTATIMAGDRVLG